MNQHFYTSEELDLVLAEIKERQQRDLLLHIDEILTALDTTSPAGLQWKEARRHIQFIEGKKSAAMAGVSIGAG